MAHIRLPKGAPFMAIVIALPLGEALRHYIDPGSGSLVLQAIIGAVAAGLVAIGMFWKQIKTFATSLLFKARKGGEPRQR